jgi:predicted transcriptional regulator
MGVVDDESKGVQVRDSEGRLQAEWKIVEGWQYKMMRNSEWVDPQAQKGEGHGGTVRMRRLDTCEDLEVAYTSGDTGGTTWKAVEERISSQVRLISNG